MDKEMVKRLKKIGIFVFVNKWKPGYNSVTSPFIRRPLCTLSKDSEEPTEEEIIVLGRIVRKFATWLGPEQVKDFKAFWINTFIFKKEKGEWKWQWLTNRKEDWSTDIEGYGDLRSLPAIEMYFEEQFSDVPKSWVRDAKKTEVAEIISEFNIRTGTPNPPDSKYVPGPCRNGNPDEAGIYLENPTALAQ